jgi:hypothetical protein
MSSGFRHSKKNQCSLHRPQIRKPLALLYTKIRSSFLWKQFGNDLGRIVIERVEKDAASWVAGGVAEPRSPKKEQEPQSRLLVFLVPRRGLHSTMSVGSGKIHRQINSIEHLTIDRPNPEIDATKI